MKPSRKPYRKQSNPELASQIGTVAREARVRLCLTQADVADRIKLKTEVYGRLERGYMLPSVPTLVRLGVVLGLGPDALLGLTAQRQGKAAGVRKPTEDGLTPEMRRLLRVVRTLDRDQTRFFLQTAQGLLDNNRRQERRQKQEESTQLGL